MANGAKTVLVVVGTRPNIIKITQFRRCAAAYPNIQVQIVHTGQHYDDRMADSFFRQLGVIPDHYLNIKPGTQVSQIAEMMVGLEKLVGELKPDLMIAVGDVNSTLAASLTASKCNVRLAHLEAGLRSRDRAMPEEINRIVTDNLSDIFFVTEQSGYDNLLMEGKPAEQLFMTGNTMIDTLVAFDQQIRSTPIHQALGIGGNPFVLMTMHRPSNVDTQSGLQNLVQLVSELAQRMHVVFPIHPRTQQRLSDFGLLKQLEALKKVVLTPPMDYFSFQHLVATCTMTVTDSGGVQEETTFRGVPCFTLRENTERPVTIDLGTNRLVPFHSVADVMKAIDQPTSRKGTVPPLWDGKSTERVFSFLNQLL